MVPGCDGGCWFWSDKQAAEAAQRRDGKGDGE
jgi:hypothetical protein